MPKTKIVLDEKMICDEYLNTKTGIETMALKYHVGKLKIRQILNKNGIEIKKRGRQSDDNTFLIEDYHIKKYVDNEQYHYEVFDEKTNFKSLDINNNGGFLTSYIKKEYNVEIPTLYNRRMYYMKTGNYWWEQWLTYRKINNLPVKKCPFCEWETTDVENKSGAFETHLRKYHNISKIDYLKIYPEDRKYFQLVDTTNNLQLEENKDKFVICKICGKKLTRINDRHLRKHGITKQEYIEKYGIEGMVSIDLHNRFSQIAIETNENMTFIKHSSDELEIIKYINDLGVECKSDRKILHGKEIDIYVPSMKIGFEYNGLIWHTEKYGKDKNYHLNKTIECNKEGVKLYHIFEDEYHNSKDIVLAKIKHILKKDYDLPKIYARKCTVQVINSSVAKDFLNKFHIQGFVSSNIYLGCYHENNLIAVMSFSMKFGDCELNRFATNYHFRCIGVGGKLFNYFIKNYNYNIIKSFADRRWTLDSGHNLYINIGFKLTEVLKPDYSYYNCSYGRYKRIHKFSLRKNKLHNKYGLSLTLSENKMTQILNFQKIWDCGKFKYVWTRNER